MLIPNLIIRGFRGLADFEMQSLETVNLITGKNNTGKSSVLEAIALYAHNAAPSAIENLLRMRGEVPMHSLRRSGEVAVQDIDSTLMHLFHGFPRAWEDAGPAVVATTDGTGTATTELRMSSLPFNGIRPSEQGQLDYGLSLQVPALEVTSGEVNFKMAVDGLFRRQVRNVQSRFPCHMLNHKSENLLAPLRKLWYAIALTEGERALVDGLKIIDPSISHVTLMPGDQPGTEIPAVRGENFPRVSLSAFGEGTNRMFALLLSLLNCQGGVFLIDEFENGLHHSIQFQAWSLIFQLALKHDIQIVATTHSRDTVEAFQRAAANSTAQAQLVRLHRVHDDLVCTAFDEDDLEVVTRRNLEVR